MIRSAALLVLLATLLRADFVSSQGAAQEESERETRLAFFQEQAAEYRLVVASDRVARKSPQPIFRWSHPVGTTVDAAMFVWMDGEQPVAVGSIVSHSELGHYCELQSVTAQSLKVVKQRTTVWEPAKPGCEFARVPNAPMPANTAAERLTQMKRIARRFSAELTKDPPYYSAGSIWRLRLLPKQLVRYGGPQATAIDGAIFAFCHDTDPEVLLLLEARGVKGDLDWHFAFAPLTGWQATGTCDDKPVWSRPRLDQANDPKHSYIRFLVCRQWKQRRHDRKRRRNEEPYEESASRRNRTDLGRDGRRRCERRESG